MKTLTLKKSKRQPRILSGHLWAYRSELEGLSEVLPGEIVDLIDNRKKFIGRGYANPLSEISFRLLTTKKEDIDKVFFENRIIQAINLRKQEKLLEQPCRLLFSEADLLPGFIVEWYPPLLILSITTAGAENLKPLFVEALINVFSKYEKINPLENINLFERSDNPARLKEGLQLVSQIIRGTAPENLICQFDDIPVAVDYKKGQKTGAFLDARDMRRHLKMNSQNKTVLDCFSHIGLFGRYAYAGGAKHVTFVETDSEPCALIKKDCVDATVIAENVFDVLRNLAKEEKNFDIIILDPPPFAKDAKAVAGALRGYKDINLRALKLLRSGGLLYTSSCSYHIDAGLFAMTVLEAAHDAKVMARVRKYFMAAPDHPLLLNVPETSYFKGMCLEILS